MIIKTTHFEVGSDVGDFLGSLVGNYETFLLKYLLNHLDNSILAVKRDAILRRALDYPLNRSERKSKGAYSTPREIADYMCAQSLIAYLSMELEGKVEKEDIVALVTADTGTLSNSIRINAQMIDDKLVSIHVCDPAVGSGALLLGMLDALVLVRSLLTEYLNKASARTLHNLRCDTIENCLYGVDIDPMAMEITKVRLRGALLAEKHAGESSRLLPNIDHTIVCGDAISGIERGFEFNAHFSEVFRDKRGFDLVIANPPYVDGRQLGEAELRELKRQYQSAQGKVNLFNIFQERAHQILKNGGVSAFIVPAPFLRNARYRSIRRFLLENSRIVEIVEFESKQFKSAHVENVLILSQKSKPNGDRVQVFDNLKHLHPKTFIQGDFLKQKDFRILTGGSAEELSLLEKVRSIYTKLGDIYQVRDGISTGFKPFPDRLLGNREGDQFVSLSGDRESFNPAVHMKVIDGGEFRRYSPILWQGRYIKYDKSLEQNPKPPEGRPFNCQLREQRIFEHRPKIISRQTANRLIMTIDEEGYYTRNSIHNIYPADNCGTNQATKYVLALLNSSLLNFVYCLSSQETGKIHPQVHIADLKELPIKLSTPTEQEPFITLVDKILAITKSDSYFENPNKQREVKELQNQIDRQVFELYGLNDRETQKIENFKSST